jgi:endonuclease/exonuclease/phosphatase family metal-dependent hydrolase
MHPDAAADPTSSRPVLRVATYNLYLGADLTLVFGADSPESLQGRARAVRDQVVATDFPARAEKIADALVRAGADVVGLQEVARWSRVPLSGDGTPGPPTVWCDFLPVLLEALAERGSRYAAHAPNPTFSGQTAVSASEAMAVAGSNVILVREDAGVAVSAARTGDYRATLHVPTGMPALVLEVARGWSTVDATYAGVPFRFVNTHTEAWDGTVRDSQRDEVLAAEGDADTPLILVGDLNAEPAEVGMPGAFLDAWTEAGDSGPGFTCGQRPDLANPTSALNQRIDYVWVRGADVAGCRVAGAAPEDRTSSGLWPSDHASVVADVRL